MGDNIILYLGNKLKLDNNDISFNNATVTVNNQPITDLQIANKIYVDKTDNQLKSANYHTVIVPLNPSVIGGQAYPTVMTTTIQNLSYDGWYYKKTLTDSVNMTVGDIYQLFFEIYLINNGKLPFITIYTKADGLSPNPGGWYKSKRTYEVLNTTLVNNTQYCCYMKLNADINTPVSYGHVKQALSNSDVVANSVGPFASTEQIYFFSLGTDSSAPVGSVEFICKSVNVQSANGTNNFIFSDMQLRNYTLENQVNNLYQYFFKQNRDATI